MAHAFFIVKSAEGKEISRHREPSRASAVTAFVLAMTDAKPGQSVRLERSGVVIARFPDPEKHWTREDLDQLYAGRTGRPKKARGHVVRHLSLTPQQTEVAKRHGETPEDGILALLNAQLEGTKEPR